MTKKLIFILPVALITFVGAFYAYANFRLMTIVDMRILEGVDSGDYLALGYESVGFKLNGDIAMKSLHITDNKNNQYILDNILISDFDYFNPFPNHMVLSVSGVRFPTQLPVFGNTPDNALNDYLASIMDEDYLPVEVNYSYQFHPEAEALFNNDLKIDLPDSFTLTAKWKMKNLAIEELNKISTADSGNSAMVFLMMQDSEISSASLSLQNLGMVDAILTIRGEELGLNSNDYAQQLITQLMTAVIFIPQQLQPLAQNIVGRFMEFLEGEKTFQLTITPKYGGSIQQLQREIMGAFYIGDFTRITELLNLEIETVASN